jgi:hypothetical protein
MHVGSLDDSCGTSSAAFSHTLRATAAVVESARVRSEQRESNLDPCAHSHFQADTPMVTLPVKPAEASPDSVGVIARDLRG